MLHGSFTCMLHILEKTICYINLHKYLVDKLFSREPSSYIKWSGSLASKIVDGDLSSLILIFELSTHKVHYSAWSTEDIQKIITKAKEILG